MDLHEQYDQAAERADKAFAAILRENRPLNETDPALMQELREAMDSLLDASHDLRECEKESAGCQGRPPQRQ